MTKFGEIVGDKKSLVLFQSDNSSDSSRATLTKFAAINGDLIRCFRIDPIKNKEIVEALELIGFPAWIAFKKGKPVLQHYGEIDIKLLNNLL